MAKLFSEGTLQWNMPSGTRRSSSPSPTTRHPIKKRHSTGEAFEYMAGCDEIRQQPNEPVRLILYIIEIKIYILSYISFMCTEFKIFFTIVCD